jgi:hypothetical protein
MCAKRRWRIERLRLDGWRFWSGKDGVRMARGVVHARDRDFRIGKI